MPPAAILKMLKIVAMAMGESHPAPLSIMDKPLQIMVHCKKIKSKFCPEIKSPSHYQPGRQSSADLPKTSTIRRVFCAFNVDNTATVTWLWETLASVLGWTPAGTRILVTNLPLEMPKMCNCTAKRKALELITDNALFLYLEVGDLQRHGPQVFMNELFLAASVLFFKVSHATRTMSVAGFLQTKSMHVLACIACCVRHAIDLVAVKRRNFRYATKSGKTYRKLLDAFSYDDDDEEMKEEHEVVLEPPARQ
ncbi:hypothetical protein BDR26DRAFT_939412 [Obelidium mucronatum]|nr:hypothetical protein BDR26DRAFT_939412 [Obelidium mucronatum]